MKPSQTVRAVESTCHWGWEHHWIAGVFGVFPDQKSYRFLRQVDRPHEVGSLGLGHLYLAVDPSRGFTHCQRLLFQVKIIPKKGHQLSPPKACGQLQIEHGENAVFLCGGEIGADLLCRERPHLFLFLGRQFAPSGGVIGDKPLLYRLIQALAEHGVETTERFGAQAQIFHTLVTLDSALGFGFVVEFLDIQRGQLVQLDFAYVGDDVFVDVVLVVGGGGFPDGGFRVILEPRFDPLSYRELAGLMSIHFSSLFQGRRQLFFAFFQRFRQHIFVDGFAGFRVVARCVAALPAAILALADVALTICSFFSRDPSPP